MSNKCLIENCDVKSKSRGYCQSHYKAKRYAGEFDGPRCIEAGCDNANNARGYCGKHYAQHKKSGEFGYKYCIVSNCDEKQVAKNLCQKHYSINRTHKINPADYEEMLKIQNGLCKICNELEKLVVDHCHSTGKIRGLLCAKCNMGIGLFSDDTNKLNSAILYLG